MFGVIMQISEIVTVEQQKLIRQALDDARMPTTDGFYQGVVDDDLSAGMVQSIIDEHLKGTIA